MKFEEALAGMRRGHEVTHEDMESIGGSLRLGDCQGEKTILYVTEGGIHFPWDVQLNDLLREDWKPEEAE